MRVHAIQTGTVVVKQSHRRLHGPEALRFPRILTDRTYTEPLPIYAWVIEHPEGVIVVDTGDNARAASLDYYRCDPAMHVLMRRAHLLQVRVPAEDEIGPQLRRLGIAPEDVRRVVLTHLHVDHVGGLAAFPNAEFLVSREELVRPFGIAPCLWPVWFAPRLVAHTDSPVGPFPRSKTLTQAGDVLLVPTLGHSAGHQSVIVRDGEYTLFLAGDTSFSDAQLQSGEVAGICTDIAQARETLTRIRVFCAQEPVVYLPSHDAASGQRLASRTVFTL